MISRRESSRRGKTMPMFAQPFESVIDDARGPEWANEFGPVGDTGPVQEPRRVRMLERGLVGPPDDVGHEAQFR